MNNIPHKVLVVKAMLATRAIVGSDTYKLIEDTIDKYPEYFEWEHKYHTIPDEVHNAFMKEAYPERWESYNNIGKSIESGNGKGIMQYIRESEVEVGTLSKAVFDKLIDDINNRAEVEYENKERIKKIWYKHYGKYNLKFRENG
jgi:hypothetical protein